MATTTTRLRQWWSYYLCNPGANLVLFGKSIGGVPPEAVSPYYALEKALIATGYVPDSVWSFNCRKIGGTNSWSLHAYGIAIDIDAPDNPYSPGDPFSGKFTEDQVAAVEAIRSTGGAQVWAWGGRWSKPDRMHWQINVPPSDTEIDWSTVIGTDEGDGDDMPQFDETTAARLQAIADADMEDLTGPGGVFEDRWLQAVEDSLMSPQSQPTDLVSKQELAAVVERAVLDRIRALETADDTTTIPSGVIMSGDLVQVILPDDN